MREGGREDGRRRGERLDGGKEEREGRERREEREGGREDRERIRVERGGMKGVDRVGEGRTRFGRKREQWREQGVKKKGRN